jgi:lipoprotein-releasing system ATP-binding protein
MSEKTVLLQAKNITKAYAQGAGFLPILKGLSLDVLQGDSLCIVGASGSGKSTLLHILGTLDRPDGGSLNWKGEDLLTMEDEQLALFRNSKMGFVFQFHHLLAEFTAVENVMLPLRIAGEKPAHAKERAEIALAQVALAERAHHFPNQLSGGELQRVAIARALVKEPEILFADEPTGNLDSHNSAIIQNLFFQLKEQRGLALVAVTHDAQFAGKFSRIYRMSDGQWTNEV